jgi:regulator of cell morphogenesis and NO signaling
MSDSTKFLPLAKELFPVLVQYVPVVDRVHGEHHPEFHEVRRLYESIYQKTNNILSKDLDLHEEFSRLQEITKDYAIPEDVCETYEAVYEMLKQLSVAYKG